MSDISANATIEVDVDAGDSAARLSSQIEDAIQDGAEKSEMSATLVKQLKAAKSQINSALESALEGVELDKLTLSERAKKSAEAQLAAIDAIVETGVELDQGEVAEAINFLKRTFDESFAPQVRPEVNQSSVRAVTSRLSRFANPLIAQVRADYSEASGRSVRRNLAALAGAVSVSVVASVARGPLRAAVNLLDRTFLSLARKIRQRFTTVIADSIIAGGFDRVVGFFGDGFRRAVEEADIPGEISAKFAIPVEDAEAAGDAAAALFAEGFGRNGRTQQEIAETGAALAQALGGFDAVSPRQFAGLAAIQDAFDVDTEDFQENIRELTASGFTTEEAIAAIGQSYQELGRTATEILNNPEELQEFVDIDTAKGTQALAAFEAQARKSVGNQFRGLLRQAQDAIVSFVAPLLPLFLSAGGRIVQFIREVVAPAMESLANSLVDFFGGDTFATISDTVSDVINVITEVFKTGEVSGAEGILGIFERIALFFSADLIEAFDLASASLGRLFDNFSSASDAVDGDSAGFSAFSVAMDLLAEAIKIVADNLDLIIPALLAYKAIQIASATATVVAATAQVVYQVALNATAIATRAWAVAQGILNVALAANPIGLAVIAIAALVAIVILAYKNSETFRNIVNAVWDAIKVGAGIVADFVGGALSALVGWFQDNKDTIFGFFSTLIDWVKQVGAFIGRVIAGVVVQYFKTWFAVVKGVFNGIRFVIENVIIPIFNRFKDDAVRVFNGVRDAINAGKTAINTAKRVFNTALDSIKRAFNRAAAPVQSLIDLVQRLTDAIPGIPSLPNLGSISIPGFAKGGIVDKATLGVFGEAGAEALIPLTDPLRAMTLLRQSGLDKLVLANQGEGNSGSTGTVTNNSTNATTNNITVVTRPGQDNGGIAKSLLRELAI